MNRAIRVVHAVTVGLWSGAVVFFNGVVAFGVFGFFGRQAQQPTPGVTFADAEVSMRLAGDLMASLFPIYFGLQCAFGFLAAATALYLAVERGRLARVRAVLLTLAFVGVLIHVGTLYRWSSEIRQQQYVALDAGRTEEAAALKARFFALHGPSLVLDWTTGVLVLASLACLAPAATATGRRLEEGNRCR